MRTPLNIHSPVFSHKCAETPTRAHTAACDNCVEIDATLVRSRPLLKRESTARLVKMFGGWGHPMAIGLSLSLRRRTRRRRSRENNAQQRPPPPKQNKIKNIRYFLQILALLCKNRSGMTPPCLLFHYRSSMQRRAPAASEAGERPSVQTTSFDVFAGRLGTMATPSGFAPSDIPHM